MPADSLFRFLLLLQAGAAAAMAGVIWVVQLVVYPGFAAVPPGGWVRFHEGYTAGISLVVVPLMLGELLASLACAVRGRRGPLAAWLWAAAGLAVATWGVTFLVQVPQHGRLAEGHSHEVIEALVAGNWPRTVLWTLRAALLLPLCLVTLPTQPTQPK